MAETSTSGVVKVLDFHFLALCLREKKGTLVYIGVLVHLYLCDITFALLSVRVISTARVIFAARVVLVWSGHLSGTCRVSTFLAAQSWRPHHGFFGSLSLVSSVSTFILCFRHRHYFCTTFVIPASG